MTRDFETLPIAIASAVGKTDDGELAFAFPEVLKMVAICTTNEIAVLGVEVFEVRADEYLTRSFSTYDLQIKANPEQRHEWLDYVGQNNALANEFIRHYPAGDDHVYVLTTSSWREFREIQGEGKRAP